MVFNSFEYILFLALVVVLYWRLKSVRLQNALILFASYLFYARWDWRFLSLLLFTTIVDYWVGRRLVKLEGKSRQYTLAVSLLVNLGVLGFFKYFNFFIDSAVDLLYVFGIQANPTSLAIILPIGISFYTFQSMAYTIDIYRGKLEPERNFLNFALFVAFFPQLAAGPIERGGTMLPQFRQARTIDASRVETGLILIFIGLFKKMVIADVAASLINPQIFVTPTEFSSAEVLQAVYLFALQIYGDFSGYSDMARGSSRLLGIEMMENFNQPYFSQTISEFWRRWHISLSTWLRDYLYIPLNNFFKERFQNSMFIYALSVMITMLLSGLWHGANYTYILWGGLLGFYQVVSRPLRGIVDFLLNHQSAVIRYITIALRILLTFHLVLLAWVLFRTPSIEQVPLVYQKMGEAFLGNFGGNAGALFSQAMVLYLLMISIDVGQMMTRDHAFIRYLPGKVRTAVYILAIFLMLFYSVKPYVPFIYFQF
jgi:alginate O-acetyltransferase complex protein AlgI